MLWDPSKLAKWNGYRHDYLQNKPSFFYGAAGAYIVNIVMSAYEKVYVYIFKDWSHVLKVKRVFVYC